MLLRLVIDRIEGGKVAMITDDGLALYWPKDKLPIDIIEGSVLYFDIKTDKEQEDVKRQQAKDILNEILNID